jgi:hypothetical protein
MTLKPLRRHGQTVAWRKEENVEDRKQDEFGNEERDDLSSDGSRKHLASPFWASAPPKGPIGLRKELDALFGVSNAFSALSYH